MLNKKSIKVIGIVLMVAMLLMVMGSSAFAATIPGATEPDTTAINGIVGTVFGVIRWGGILAAVAIAMFIGIKFITASPEGKAEVKKTLMFYIAGIVILLSAAGIVTLIGNSIKPGSITNGDAPAASTGSVVTTINA